ncbi:MAG: VWA domain-containing protein [Hydrogenimonas sp.]|nr:VWA domain-containing protein [Hydrogenimonas sp.]
MSGSFMFEHPLAFSLLLLFILCERFCKARFETLLFSGVMWLKEADKKSFSLSKVLRWAAFFLLVAALASPVVKNEVVEQKDMGYEISLILDASGSMADGGKFRIVKSIVEEFIKKRAHDRIGLTIFADFAYVAVPLTYDKESLLRLLDRVEVGIAGTSRTALYEALFMSTKLFKNSKAKNKIAILLTDGIDNAGTVPLDVAINTARKYGIKVYTIGVGQPGDFNPYVLQKIAKETDGKYFEADSVERLKEVYRTIDSLEKSEINAKRYVQKSYLYIWPLGAALVLMSLLLFRRRR